MKVAHRVVLFLLAGWFGLCLTDIASADQTIEERIAARVHSATIDDDDPLLFQLEKDFLRLLKHARDPLAMLKAEELLVATNDNTHWTNYSKATSVIRKSPDKAAIPLLLRFMVLHVKRSAKHVMIPEYARTVTLLSGRKVDDRRPTDEKSVRQRVQKIVDEWWTAYAKQDRSSDDMTTQKLKVISLALLEEVRRSSDFSGSGGKQDTAYRAYHNVVYRIPARSSSENFRIKEVRPGMARFVLEPSGYNADGEPTKDPSDQFRYEAIPILAELVKHGGRDEVRAIADDENQNTSVRMICIFALFRAGEPFQRDVMIKMLNKETTLQRRLIILCSLRWAGAKAKDVLLKHMKDDNIEIATAAATAISESRPEEALPIFQELLLHREHPQSPLLVLDALAKYKSPQAIEILEQMLTEALEVKSKEKHLGRILGAYVDAANLPRLRWSQPGYSERAAARLALSQYREKIAAEANNLLNQTALLESVRTQLSVASQIYSLRKTEYKRLLVLQGDEVTTAADTKVAFDAMKQAQREVSQLKQKLFPLEAAAAK